MIEFITGFAFAAVIALPWIIDQQYTINRLKDEQKGEDHEPKK